MKKFLSILLAVVLVLSTFTVGFAGAVDMKVNETTLKTKSKGIITLSAAPEDEQYAWGDEVVFNVDVTNNTGTDYENVKVRAQANKAKFFYDGESNTVAVGSIKAGETQTIQISVKSSTPGILQRLIVLPIYYILDFFSPMAFKASNYDATALAKVGVFKYKFGFDVTDGNSVEAKPDKPDVPVEPDKEVTISFNLNYAGAPATIPAQTVKAGEKAAAVTAPVRNGYTFMGWFTNPSCEEEYRFSFLFPIYDDLTVYAKWEKISAPSATYTVSFNLNYDGAPTIRPQTVSEGGLAIAVEAPEREGFEFIGWFTNDGSEFDFNSAITTNIVLYAKWLEISASGLAISIDQNDFETTDNIARISGRFTCDNLDTIAYVVDPFFYETGSSTTGEVIIDGITWSTSIVLKPGDNKINFTVKSLDGEEKTATITVTYSIGSSVEYEIEDISYDEDEGVRYLNNIIGIYFEDGTSAEKIDEVVTYLNGEYAGVNYPINKYWIRIPKTDLSGLNDLIDYLEENYECVETASIDELYEEAAVSANDPWGNDVSASDWLDEDVDGSNWGLEAIEAAKAWDHLDRMKLMKIGVVDNGFTTTNRDSDFFYVLSDNNTVETGDHGSHVAGTIGATSNNDNGITGVMYNRALVYCYDAKPDSSTEFFDSDEIEKGIVSLVQAGAKAVNISIGSSGSLSDENDTKSDKTINNDGKNASNLMLKLLKKKDGNGNRLYDFVIIQSAGNGAADHRGVDSIYNGRFCSVTESNCKSNSAVSKQDILNRIIIVAAAQHEKDDNGNDIYMMRTSSNCGDTTDIAAPGTDIRSIVNNGFGNKSGTSMAAPHVTGVAGLVWAINPYFTGAEVKDIIVNSTKDIVRDNPASSHAVGDKPMVNAYLAVEEAIRRTDALGTFKARFSDAATGYSLLGVKMKCIAYEGHHTGALIGNEYTANSDQAELQLPAGTYTFQFTYGDYIPATFTFTIRANETTDLNNISLSKEIGDNEVRVVLHWGRERPSDLDSHFNGKTTSGSMYHVYYSSRGSSSYAWLDRDDTDYEGPETVTINMNNFEDFTYSIHNYSDRGSSVGSSGASVLATSGAYVEVFVGAAKVATYNVPTNRMGTVWNVFKMDKNGTITFINSFDYISSPSSVGYVSTAIGGGSMGGR